MPNKRVLNTEEQLVLRTLFYSNLGVSDISKNTGISYRVIQRYWKQWFSSKEFDERCSRLNRICKIGSNNPMFGKKGVKHHNHRKGKTLINGYYTVIAPFDWKGTFHKGSRVYEHILVYCRTNGLSALPKGNIIHHKDGDKLNNSPSNLEIMTIGEHLRMHNTTHGKYIKKRPETIQ